MVKQTSKRAGETTTRETTTRKTKSQGMKITSRIVDVRRHTTGYVAGGKKYSVSQIRNMAAKGRVKGVQVVGNHVQAVPGRKRLTDLPTKVMK